MKKLLAVVMSLIGAFLWLFGTFAVSIVVLGERRILQWLVGGVIVAGFGAAILWSGRVVNRSVATKTLLVGIVFGVLAVFVIAVQGSRELVEHLEFVFVGVVTGLFLWALKSRWKNKKDPTSIGS